ncbi:MAG: DUF308 domain-containing protein [Candidatus Enteromonas sp.]|nr:DUF308 domain-containing protein [Candidatus Enteromonas sp.]
MKRKKNFGWTKGVGGLLKACLTLAMAILFFVYPSNAMNVVYYVFLAFILGDGVVSLLLFFLSFGMTSFLGLSVFGAILKILFAVLGFVNPTFYQGVFGIFLAIYIILLSCGELQQAMFNRKFGRPFVFSFVLGLLCLIGGIVLLFVPSSSQAMVYGILAGIILLIESLNRFLLLALSIRKKKKDEPEEIEVIDVDVID